MKPKLSNVRIAVHKDVYPSGYHTVPGVLLDRAWAATKAFQHDRRWTLTHRPTGLAAARFLTLPKARRLAAALTKRCGVKRWMFTDEDPATRRVKKADVQDIFDRFD